MATDIRKVQEALDRYQQKIQYALERHCLNIIYQPALLLPLQPQWSNIKLSKQITHFHGSNGFKHRVTKSSHFRHSQHQKNVTLDNIVKIARNHPQPLPQLQKPRLKSKGKLQKTPIPSNHVIPKKLRKNPFAGLKPVKLQELHSRGLYNLINQGHVPRNVDITPAFQKGKSVLKIGKARIFQDIQAAQPKSQVLQEQEQQQQWPLTQINQLATIKPKIPRRFRIDVQPYNPPISKFYIQKRLYPEFQKSIQYHVQFVNFKLKRNNQLNQLLQRDFGPFVGQLQGVFKQIQYYLKYHNYITMRCSVNKIITLVFQSTKLTSTQIKTCFVCHTHFQIPKNINQAAILIQKYWKAFRIKRIYSKGSKLKAEGKKLAKLIISSWIKYKMNKKLAKQRMQLIQKFRVQQQNFKSKYNQIIEQQHVRVQIPNDQQQMHSQVVRLFQLGNKNTSIIMVCNWQPSQEMISYFQRILDLNDIPFKQKLHFFSVDPKQKYPQIFRTTNIMYFQNKIIQKLKHKIGGKNAFMSCGKPSFNDLRISLLLGIPILSGPFQQTSYYSSKIGAAVLYNKINLINKYQIINPKSTVKHLCFQAFKLSQVWKCDLLALRLDKTNAGVAQLQVKNLSAKQVSKSIQIIGKRISKKDFLNLLLKQGGLISPYQKDHKDIDLQLFVSQQNISIIATYNRLNFKDKPFGCSFPQSLLPHQRLIEIVQAFKKQKNFNLFGYVTMHLMINRDTVIGLDIDCYKTKFAAGFDYFQYLMRGKLNNQGQYKVDIQEDNQTIQQQPRYFFYIPVLKLPALQALTVKSFFPMCRSQGISFDLISKFGTTFVLLNQLTSGVLGVLNVADSKTQSGRLFIKVLKFLSRLGNKSIQLKELIDYSIKYI